MSGTSLSIDELYISCDIDFGRAWFLTGSKDCSQGQILVREEDWLSFTRLAECRR